VTRSALSSLIPHGIPENVAHHHAYGKALPNHALGDVFYGSDMALQSSSKPAPKKILIEEARLIGVNARYTYCRSRLSSCTWRCLICHTGRLR
jgi:hypothetical protein